MNTKNKNETQSNMLTRGDVTRLFEVSLNHQIRVLIDAYIGHQVLLITASDLHPDDHLYITFEIYQMIYILHLSKMITDQGKEKATFNVIFKRILESDSFNDDEKNKVKTLKKIYNSEIFNKYPNALNLIKMMRNHYYAHNIFIHYSKKDDLKNIINAGYLEIEQLTYDFIDFLHYIYEFLSFNNDFQTIKEMQNTIQKQKSQLNLL